MKLKSISSPTCGEVLSSQELMSIVGGCSVIYDCYCYYKKKGTTYSDWDIMIPTPSSKESCDAACKAYYQNDVDKEYNKCDYKSNIKLCDDPFCTMFGSGSGSGS